ncbi:MAG: wax ester/triacylglycerol synthase family O-acyltransferase [Kiloniellales bacterium]|nr:wax ester/triacylglycerol synthase family O-acyltransferase [Kiloniellales bacterium]
MANSERMAAVDTTWLRFDRASNPMVIVGILMLEGPVDADRVQETIVARLLSHSRFKQRVETRLTGLWWSADRHFNLDRHIKRVRLPGAGGRAELEDFVADLASHRLDRARPLWQFHIVEGYDEGVALVVRIHHAIADGIALISVLLSLTDDRPDAPPVARAEKADGGQASHEASLFNPLEPVVDMIGEGLRLYGEAWREAMTRAADPAAALRDGAGISAEIAHLLAMPSDSATRFKGKPCGDKRLAWTDPIDLREVKAISHLFGCSVNDVLLASVTGALHQYLKDKGDPTRGVELRAIVPVNLRQRGGKQSLGNHFGVIGVELPVGMDNPIARLYEIFRRTQALKHSYEPPVTLGIMTALGYAPQILQDRLMDLLVSRCTAVMTNVPGPQHPLYLGGARIKQVMFWVPQAGDVGMGVSILSFDGKVQFGLMTDTAIIPDPDEVIARFVPAFEQFVYFGLMEASIDPPPDAVAAPAAKPVREPASRKLPRKRTAKGSAAPRAAKSKDASP